MANGIFAESTFKSIVMMLTGMNYFLLVVVFVTTLAVVKKKAGRTRVVYLVILPILVALAGLNRLAQVSIPKMEASSSRVVLGTILALLFGLLLFTVKISRPMIYGALEGIFAIGSCAVSLSIMSDFIDLPHIIVLITSIYLMVRALDNIKKGLDARRHKPGAAEKVVA